MVSRVALFPVLAIALLLAPMPYARADRLAGYRDGADEIALMTESCGAKNRKGQRAVKRSSVISRENHGCWSVNARGNPVAVWNDGAVQELDASRVTLAPKYHALLEDAKPGEASNSRKSGAADFPRPGWCEKARQAHERLICRDAGLSAADLVLAPLWRSYRSELKPEEQRRVKRDYTGRLKACGAHKQCIAREQAAQTRLYREATGGRAGTSSRP